MNCFCNCLFLLVLLLIVAGCGGGGTTGTASTVAVTAGITNNTAASVFAHYSSNGSFVSNDINITLTSTSLNGSGTVPVSPVLVKSVTVALNPKPYSSTPTNTTNLLSPTITNPQFAFNNSQGGTIPGPGTLKLPISVFGINDSLIDINHFTASKLLFAEYNYEANITFYLNEQNTGNNFSVSIPIAVSFDY